MRAGSLAWVQGGSGLDLIFHPIAFSLDEDGLGMVEEAAEDCRGEGRAGLFKHMLKISQG